MTVVKPSRASRSSANRYSASATSAVSPTRKPKREPETFARALELEAPDLGVLLRLGELRRLAPALDLDRVLLGHPVGGRLVRRIRHLRQRRVALGLRRRELGLELVQPRLARLELLELLRRRLSLQLLLRAQLVDLRHELAPARVRGHQRVERLGRAAPRERRAKAFGIVACGADVDHRAKNASITCATPSSSADGQTKSARALTSGCAFSTATRVAGPVDQLEVVLAVAERDRAAPA